MVDVIQLIDSNTKENVNYEVISVWYDGSPMDDSKVDNVIYRKKGEKYYVDCGYLAGNPISIMRFGAKGNGINDDSDAFNKALSVMRLKGGHLLIPQTNRYYVINSPVKVLIPENISIYIEGIGMPELRRTLDVGGNIIEINTPSNSGITNNSISIKNITINGVGVPEQWELTDYASLKRLFGIYSYVDNVYVENVKLINIYGYGVRVARYVNADIKNIITENVGGSWYQIDNYDSFGDSIHIGHAKSPESYVKIQNCSLNGYSLEDRPRSSRIGITFEYGAAKAIVENCHIDKYSRSIHVENCPDIDLTVKNSSANNYNMAFYGKHGCKSIILDNYYGKGYFGKGTRTSFGGRYGYIVFDNDMTVQQRFDVNNSVIYVGNNSEQTHFSYQDAVKFENCKILADTTHRNITWASFTGSIVNCEIRNACLNFFAGTKKLIGCRFYGYEGHLKAINTIGGSKIEAFNCTIEDGYVYGENNLQIFENCTFKYTKPGAELVIQVYAVNPIFRKCIIDMYIIIPLTMGPFKGPFFEGINEFKYRGVLRRLVSDNEVISFKGPRSNFNYDVGNIIHYPDPIAFGYIGEVCTDSGTIGTLNSNKTFASNQANTSIITVNTVNGLFVGAYIRLGSDNTRRQVGSIEGAIVTLTAIINESHTDVAVSFYNPVFKSFGALV